MAGRGLTEKEFLRILRAAEAGETVVDVRRKAWNQPPSFYLSKKNYAGLGLNELRELREVPE